MPAWRMDDDCQIEAELQCDFYLLACSPPIYSTNLHKNFTWYSGFSVCVKPCIYKVLLYSILERQSNEWRWSILTSTKMLQN